METYIIVGGSKGIGKAILEEIVNENKVINLSRSAPEIEHPNLVHYSIDILEDELPELDEASKLIYCPGSISLKPLMSLKIDNFIEDYKINTLGAIKAIKKYYKLLRKSGNGSVVLFSTVAVAQGMPFHSSIAAAKGAVEALTRSLAAEFAPHIRVNCVAPSLTRTELAQNLLRNETMVENAKQRHPLKRIMDPADIAAMAVFLSSEKAKNITGQIIGVDAGLSSLKV